MPLDPSRVSISAVKEFDFCFAHRLFQYKGKCESPHGHNYKMEVELHSHLLDAQGMVIDFVELKKIISAWVNATLDHSWVVYEKDVTVINALRVIAVDSMDSVRTVVVPFNPTAENVANWLLASVFPALFTSAGYQHVNVLRVSLWETPTSVAHARAVWD